MIIPSRLVGVSSILSRYIMLKFVVLLDGCVVLILTNKHKHLGLGIFFVA